MTFIKNLMFSIMARKFRKRDKKNPPKEILENAGLKKGANVLDFGCGPGSFSIAAAEIVGERADVFALDNQQIALDYVIKSRDSGGYKNIKTILSGCETGLDNEGIDFVIFYDVYHSIKNPDMVLRELHRVLKADGILSFSDHHLTEYKILLAIEGSGLFRLSQKEKTTYRFAKV